MRARALTALFLPFLITGCGDDESVSVPGHEGATKSAATVRAERRMYDGAPPVVPHQPFGVDCISCHNRQGRHVEGIGFAPPSPHAHTAPPSNMSRCRQCHLFRRTGPDQHFAAGNGFSGLRQDLRKGERLHEHAPPVIPHQILLRENCAACHTGPAAREPIRTTHPERHRCRQCHLEQRTTARFER